MTTVLLHITTFLLQNEESKKIDRPASFFLEYFTTVTTVTTVQKLIKLKIPFFIHNGIEKRKCNHILTKYIDLFILNQKIA